MMASRRKSRRLNGERPEITDTHFRCLCLNEGEACDLSATQVPCCKQFCHRKCLEDWQKRGNQTCPFCRQLIEVAPRVDPLQPVPGNLDREQVIARLETLLSNPNLRSEIERVSHSFFYCFYRRCYGSQWCGESGSKRTFLVFLKGLR